ncbi:MAG TPA: type III PLP-dependent enzyme [Geopsychrobacteraceae bacterium]|nr:type III PLP-dependent enzyme [Geopsychrobacteraceae bacterium]
MGYDKPTIKALAEQYGTPLFVIDCDRLRKQYSDLCQSLPDTDFYYAVKALPHESVVETFLQSGAGFDIASSGEIEILRKVHADPRHTIHTHPIKKDQDIRDALRFGCTTFVIDNDAELDKFRQYRHRVGLLLRISFRSPSAVVDLSKKFGCLPEDVPALLRRAETLGIHIKGLSFHVGSQSMEPDTHVQAINDCNELMKEANETAINPMSILDIGGGFPVGYAADCLDIGEFCKPIHEAIRALPGNIHTIAEPGRYLVASAAISISSVIGKTVRGNHAWYYLDDGVYGNYSGMIYDHAVFPIHALKEGELFKSVLAGPTCDSIDVIAEDIDLPELEIGDLIVGEMMGAYTLASATEFNSLPKSQVAVLNTKKQERVIYHIA